MNYEFTSTQRSINIDDEVKFDQLSGEELSELLYEDPRYINWMTSYHLKKISTEDAFSVMMHHPQLLRFFILKIEKLNDTQWTLLVSKHPQLILDLRYVNYLLYQKINSIITRRERTES